MVKNISPTTNRPPGSPTTLVTSPPSSINRMNPANAPKAANTPYSMPARRSIPEKPTLSSPPSSIPTPGLRRPSQEDGKGTTNGEIRRSHQNQGSEVTKTGGRPSTVVMHRLSHESHDLEEVVKRLDAMEQRMQQLDTISEQLNTLMMAVNKLSRQLHG